MSAIDKLSSELNAERQKLALYEKNLRVAVESCKVLKSEKENLANIIAGFACAEIKAGATEFEQLKQKIALLTKEFQTKENALVLARTSVLKENSELKKLLAEAESTTNSSPDKSENGFHVAELEQKLRKEIALNRKYEKRLQQLEEKTNQSTVVDDKNEKIQKRLEQEREQFKKLYEDAHGRSIYLERKFASLQIDQKKDEAEKTVPGSNKNPEDDYRVNNLEAQIMILSKQCDDRENELSDLSTFVTALKGENISLKERLEQFERCKSATPLQEADFIDVMTEKYEAYKSENNDAIEFCCPALKNDILTLIDESLSKNSKQSQVKEQQIQIANLEKTIKKLNAKIEEHDSAQANFEKKLKKMEVEIQNREEQVLSHKEEIQKIKEKVREEKTRGDELEHEVSKQRSRAQQEIDSRDKEIEAFRKMLVNYRSDKIEKSSAGPRKISRHNRSSHHDEDAQSVRRSRTFSVDDGAVPTDPDSKNVYYENQISKKECDIQDLRKQLIDVEVRLRENESVAMSRQLESVARADDMTEKVRVLEGKLQMLSSTNEIDYLRNIFTQFLHSMGSPSIPSKPILKAMGSVLKVPFTDLKLIDKK